MSTLKDHGGVPYVLTPDERKAVYAAVGLPPTRSDGQPDGTVISFIAAGNADAAAGTNLTFPERNIARHDGFLVDADTGEVLGLAEESPGETRFEVDDDASAEWVMSKLFDLDSQIAGLGARERAILENIAKMRKPLENRRAYLLRRFEADLRNVAATMLGDKKTRTWRTPFGELSFRKTAGSIKVKDEAAALEWCRQFVSSAIKVKETVVVTPLKGMEAELPADIFEVTGPGETFSIKTGLGRTD